MNDDYIKIVDSSDVKRSLPSRVRRMEKNKKKMLEDFNLSSLSQQSLVQVGSTSIPSFLKSRKLDNWREYFFIHLVLNLPSGKKIKIKIDRKENSPNIRLDEIKFFI